MHNDKTKTATSDMTNLALKTHSRSSLLKTPITFDTGGSGITVDGFMLVSPVAKKHQKENFPFHLFIFYLLHYGI